MGNVTPTVALPGDETFKSGDQFVANSVSSQPPAGRRKKKKREIKKLNNRYGSITRLKCSSACQVS